MEKIEHLSEVLYLIDLYENFNATINMIILIGFFGFFLSPFLLLDEINKKKKIINLVKKFYFIWGISLFIANITPTNKTFKIMIFEHYYGENYQKYLKESNILKGNYKCKN